MVTIQVRTPCHGTESLAKVKVAILNLFPDASFSREDDEVEADAPTFQHANLSTGSARTGPICPDGTSCQGNRQLLDYFALHASPETTFLHRCRFDRLDIGVRPGPRLVLRYAGPPCHLCGLDRCSPRLHARHRHSDK